MKSVYEIRTERGLTQAALGRAAGVSQATVCQIERGKRMPTIKTARRLAAVLGIPWTELYEDQGEQPSAGK